MELSLPHLIFWMLFFLANVSIFIPSVVINYDRSAWFPFKRLLTEKNQGPFCSHVPDFYKLCLDVSVIIFLCLIFSPGKTLILMASGYYSLLFIYNIYHHAFYKIYQSKPLIISDLRLMKDGAVILWKESSLKFILYLVGAVLLIFSASWLFYRFLSFTSSLSAGVVDYMLMAGIAGVSVICILRSRRYWFHPDDYLRYLIMPQRIFSNFKRSVLVQKNTKNLATLSEGPSLKLSKKPNIYLLFIESYGTLLQQEETIKEPFQALLQRAHDQLKGEGWHLAHNTTESVSLTGPSWMAYTSVLLGYKISTNYEFDTILKDPDAFPKRSLAKLFKAEGYKSFNLNASKPVKGLAVPMEKMTQLYGVDQWILEHDIDYQGPTYGFVKNPPDQYVLNYAFEEVLSQSEDPFFLFYLTKNSHAPYISPTFETEDWRSLEGEECVIGEELLRNPSVEDYFHSITYQWEMLTDYIRRNGREEDVFILLGDHQPHGISSPENGHETFIHVVSKYEEFVKSFIKAGFKTDLKDSSTALKHEDIYALLINQMNEHFNSNGEE